ncbi:MAG: Hsp70 family protein [Muribaculaceae bacterium]|nr:Hsp70 family protein [Muribaculaceae bacterium]
MKTNRIIYGIDLGTTNSAISRIVNGFPVTVKSNIQRPVIPSCVAVTRRGAVVVGDKAHNLLQRDYTLAYESNEFSFNSFIEFKRQMGKDVRYFSTILNRGFTPEELSAEVLMELKRMVYDDDVRSAVITVPAMFDNNQKDATVRAARKAGLDYVELLQEPIAASIAYGVTADRSDKFWLVFDMGGGTFDVALMRMQNGIVSPVDTTGCNTLGGKDIDEEIIDALIIPHLRSRYKIDQILTHRPKQFKAMWKNKVEEAKIALSTLEQYTLESDLDENFGVDDLGEPIELELVISRAVLDRIQRPFFHRAIDLTLNLLRRAVVDPSKIRDIVLVGGPTMTPLLREMLREAIPANIRDDIDPMTCVSHGAALYASTITLPETVLDSVRNNSKVQLEVIAKGESAELREYASVKLLTEKSGLPSDAVVSVEFTRNDGCCTTGPLKINAQGDVVELPLKKDCINLFTIRCYSPQGKRLECEPAEISVIQGVDGIADAIMPLSMGVGVSNNDDDEVFKTITGLQRGVRLPATGVIRGLRTRQDIIPGDCTTEIRISLYQKEEYEDMVTRAILCNHLYDVIINGDDLPAILPAGSDVNLRLHADKSGRIDSFVVDIPYLDIELDVTDRVTAATKSEIPLSIATHEASVAIQKARTLDKENVANEISSIIRRFTETDDRELKDSLFEQLRRISEEVDREFNSNKVDRAVNHLHRLLNIYAHDVKKYGSADDERNLERCREEISELVKTADYDAIKEFTNRLWLMNYKLAKADFFISWVCEWNNNFDKLGWRDPVRARYLIDRLLGMSDNDATAREMTPVFEELKSMLPDYQVSANDILQG